MVERKDDRAKEAAGALQEFTTGPVHEHVKVGPEAHGWLSSRMSSTCMNSYVCVGDIRMYGEAAETLEPAQVAWH